MKRVSSACLCAAFLVFSTCGSPVGFYNPDQGAKPQSMANAYVAQADDPSAAYYNPAAVAWMEGYAIQIGGMFYASQYRVHGAERDDLGHGRTTCSFCRTCIS